MSDATPTTEAGRRLLDDLVSLRGSRPWGNTTDARHALMVAAIETQAAAAATEGGLDVERLAEALRQTYTRRQREAVNADTEAKILATAYARLGEGQEPR